MATYQSRNNNVINAAFRRFKEQYHQTMVEGLTEIAKKALAYLVELHESDPTHHEHIIETNTIGYAVGCDGSVVISSFGHPGDGDGRTGHASELAESVILGKKSGWSVVVLSEMEGWYNEDFERLVLLGKTVEFTRDNFHEFFRKIEQ